MKTATLALGAALTIAAYTLFRDHREGFSCRVGYVYKDGKCVKK